MLVQGVFVSERRVFADIKDALKQDDRTPLAANNSH